MKSRGNWDLGELMVLLVTAKDKLCRINHDQSMGDCSSKSSCNRALS